MVDGRHSSPMRTLVKVTTPTAVCRVYFDYNDTTVLLLADILVGLLWLTKCSPNTFRPELKGGVSIV